MRASWILVTVLAGCGGSSSSPDAAVAVPDATRPDAGPCNTIANVASDVAEMAVAEAAPPSTGGTLVDGTYVVTAAVVYTGVGGQAGATGVTYHATSIDTAGQYDYIDTGVTPPVITSGNYATFNVDDITVTQQCPPTGPISFHKYTASPTEFTLYDNTNAAAVRALTFSMP